MLEHLTLKATLTSVDTIADFSADPSKQVG
jgi:hypothetical protein